MDEPQQIGTLLKAVSKRLETVSESPRLDAEILLGRAIDMPRSYLLAHPDDAPDEAALDRLERSIRRRLDGEPMAYITGIREFWSMQLFVSPATLVPRPDTEILVDRALSAIPRRAEWRVLDLGTGSGAIALAIARERPLTDVVAIDVSRDALAVAELNARELGIANVEFVQGDWTAPVSGQHFDMIVSNPPYVRESDAALEALRHEPREALVAGPDGLSAIRTLAEDCYTILVAGGSLLLEHGAEQEADVATVLHDNGWLDVACHRDYAGLPRVTVARTDSTDAPASEL